MRYLDVLMYTTVFVLGLLTATTLYYKRSTWAYLFARDKPEHFNATRLPRYFLIILGSAAALSIYALIFTRNGQVIAQFVLGNLFFIAVGCINLVLYTKNNQEK